jgi:glycosyltransferase involved in cell wall biosynthesis
MEKCTIILGARDRYSTLPSCVETLFRNTPDDHDVICVMGGVPDALQEDWRRRFGDRARFIFRPEFLSQPAVRNLGLAEAQTRLAVVMDCDNFVRPGWIEALVRCQNETGAVMVVPLLLESEHRIHAAGNDLYIDLIGGVRFGHKHLRCHRKPYHDGSNLTRSRVDYGELHCQLLEVEPTLRLGAFDERLIEIGEVDSGLTWAKAGLEMWFEPAAVVVFAREAPIASEDIRFFEWRWNMRRVGAGCDHFRAKWDLDITEEGGLRVFVLNLNRRLGLLPRLLPSYAALKVDAAILKLGTFLPWLLGKAARAPIALVQRWGAYRFGYYGWPELPKPLDSGSNRKRSESRAETVAS